VVVFVLVPAALIAVASEAALAVVGSWPGSVSAILGT